MAIINISRQPHSFGNELAVKIAKNLDYTLIDKFIINRKVNDVQCDFSEELRELTNEKGPPRFKWFFKNSQVYSLLVQSIILEAASHDKVVINGRGGQYVLNQPYALNVRVIAPFELRCACLEQEKGISSRAARKQLEMEDFQRKNFIRYLFDRDISEPGAYDLVLNHHKLGPDVMVSTILEYAQKIETAYPLTDHHKNNLKRLAVEKRVEATLKKQGVEHEQLTVECEKLGAVKIKGFVLNETYGKRMYQLAQLCHGVDFVDNQLIRQIPGV